MEETLNIENSPLQHDYLAFDNTFHPISYGSGTSEPIGEIGTFSAPAPHGTSLESNDVFISEILNVDAFTSFYSTDVYKDLGGPTTVEEHRRDLALPHLDAIFGDSPQSSSCSEDWQRIILQHYGPGCWLSVCSPSGLAWVRNQSGLDGFESIAADLATAWTKQLRLERNEPIMRTAEPCAELAQVYSNAYFERSVDSLFGIADRSEFEWHLHGHLDQNKKNDNPAWYALRNAVYASGCRLYHSEHHVASFVCIQEEAWGYFSNALSVHSELLLSTPSIRAVQALLAMALFAEGLGSPGLGSGLIANATLLAQSLGMHRECAIIDASQDFECLRRSWLFWTVYCCEKNIARRIGRSSVIDDDDIGCDIPTEEHPSSKLDLQAFRFLIQTCQISSKICKSLMTAKKYENHPAKFLELINKLDDQLCVWRDSLPLDIQPQSCLKQFQFSRSTKSLIGILLQSSYYDLMMVLHAPFAYPWLNSSFSNGQSAENQAQITAQAAKSSEEMATAARNIIIMARSFDMDGANTHSFMLHYPMHAFINLFVYILRAPSMRSVRTDLALLDVMAGYFGQMNFVTGSRLSFPFARDIAAFGRRAVDSHTKASAVSASGTMRNNVQNSIRIPTETQVRFTMLEHREISLSSNILTSLQASKRRRTTIPIHSN